MKKMVHGNEQVRSLIPGTTGRTVPATLPLQPATAGKHRRSFTTAAMAIVFALTIVLLQSAQAQTYTVLHNFTGGVDGQNPSAGVVIDRAGNLYGTTYYGGTSPDSGAAFKLARKGNSFVFTPLHSFNGVTDGSNPYAVTIGPDGALYGTTEIGADGYQPGTVYSLRLPATACKSALCPWNVSLVYQFPDGGQNGGHPDSPPIFDQTGNMFGATPGDIGYGNVYELQPSGGGWIQSVLYAFTGGSDGSVPHDGVIRDQAGNLYGVTYRGGANNGGVVYQLVPTGNGWTEKVLHSFNNASEGTLPVGGLVFDKSGNLYGTTTEGGSLSGGSVFMLSPSGSGWTSTVLYSFPGYVGPSASLSVDTAGNLYGTTSEGGANEFGSIFKLSPGSGGWTYTSLKDFSSNCSDGCIPLSTVTIDSGGNLYGTTAKGGSNGNYGVVWEILKP